MSKNKFDLTCKAEITPAKAKIPEILASYEKDDNIADDSLRNKRKQIIKGYYKQVLLLEKMCEHMNDYFAELKKEI